MPVPAVIPGPEPERVLAGSEITDAEVLASFLGSLSPHTRRAYSGDLRALGRHLGNVSSGEAVRCLLGGGPGPANRVALAWRSAMEASGLSAATIARRVAAVRGPGRGGWRAMVAELAAGEGPLAARDLAIVRLLHDLMGRRGEAVGLELQHLEVDGGGRPVSVWILGKGRSARERKELAPVTVAALEAWLKIRGLAPGPVFLRLDRKLSPPYRAMDGGSIARIVARAGVRAGLDRPVRPHGLRHEGITRAIEMGESLLDVQIAARHADPRTTQRYVDRVRDPSARISRLISED
jgi:integrase/recombinase XerC